MPLTLDQMKHKRSWSKGAVTKVATQIRAFQGTKLSKLDSDAVRKQLELLAKADECFETHHQGIFEHENGDEEQFQDELLEHQETVLCHKRTLQGLIHSSEAFELVASMEESLDAMEISSGRVHCPSHDAELERVVRLVQDFREARTKKGASDDSDLKDLRDQALVRLERIIQAHEASKVPASLPEVVPAKEAPPSHRRLKIPPPVFDGTILGWKNFWELFSALLKRDPSMEDVDKRCLLIEAMGTPDAKAAAMKATANSTSFAKAVETLQHSYDKNRVVHGHHYREMCRQDSFGDFYADVNRMWDRIRDCRRGITLAKGYSADQMFTIHFERMMKPTLLRRWMDFTPTHKDTPPVDVLLEFLDIQRTSTATSATVPHEQIASTSQGPQKTRSSPKLSGKTVHHLQPATTRSDKCYYCNSDHTVFNCTQFRQMNVPERRDWAKSANLCSNCFSTKHLSDACTSRYRCQTCKGQHHTLLHDPTDGVRSNSDVEVQGTVKLMTAERPTGDPAYSMPNTAIIKVRAMDLSQKARAQLDSGATISLITSALASTLHAQPVPNSDVQICGFTGAYCSPHKVKVVLMGTQGEEVTTMAHVVEAIPPTKSRLNMRDIRRLPFLQHLTLSDPHYQPTSRIDMLLDFGTSNSCAREGLRRSPSKSLKAENTIFGWTVGGHHYGNEQSTDITHTCLKVSAEENLEPLLLQFWEQEQITSDDRPLSSDDQKAVEHFHNNLTRDDDGRYRVSLPRRQPTPELGRSRDAALRRFIANERSLKQRGIWEQYRPAISEYGELGHAELVPECDLRCPCSASFYMPMHGVIKASSSTTKLRVVCDASARSTNGISLNDTLLPGPSLYPLLTSVINRFRTHPIGMTSDISKMFREIGLNAEERDYHRFLQRGSDDQIQDWRMTRLTFGVASSPYLATQVLHQLATDYQQEHPLAADVVKSSFYVDDCLTGAQDLETARNLREDLNQLCSKARMTLRKWRTSSSALLQTIPVTLRETSDLQIVAAPGEHAKALGLHWNTDQDCFYVATPEVDPSRSATRRIIASIVARTFDALGWFSPALLPAKVLLKETWSQKLGWDDPLPPELQSRWKVWSEDLNNVTSFPIPRYIGLKGRTVVDVQLHGFSDASLLAYGGVVYKRTLYSDMQVSIDLVSSKSRVAPIKTLTVPRLELCGALLLAQLLDAVAKDLSIPTQALFAWCDSSAVLGWINKSPALLSVYVANRVEKTTALMSSDHWRYVNTSDNPADCLSRGMDPSVLFTTRLWWSGPLWLSLCQEEWPRRPDINFDRELSELKGTVLSVSVAPDELGRDVSTYDRLIRVMCRVIRFIRRVRGQKSQPMSSPLTLAELRDSEALLLRHSQHHFYQDVFQRLESGRPLHKRHPLASLSPFIDKGGYLRVGGRLQKAELEPACSQPLILHASSHIVLLMVRRTHRLLMHAGPSTVMATLAPTYHIRKLRPLIRKISQSCVPCQKAYARTSSQLMGQLPKLRTQPSFTFNTVGIDFAGPFMIKRGNPRRPDMVKCYLCVFIDFTCRATHLEVVSDMTTPAFLAALSRFTARRGTPAAIYTDNGTNFVGAEAELRRMLESLRSAASLHDVNQWASQNHVAWHFSPARAPHFGGLWESTVKLAKSLLKKTVGDRRLNFEELTTFAASAEAVINSRPLVPLHSTSDDAVSALTPGHFLVGRSLKALPSTPDVSPILSHIRRWNLVVRLTHDFWTRWRTEYLLLLQKKNRWLQPSRNMQEGDVVLIKDRDAFQRVWPMGRITKVYPGEDDLVRVVDVMSQGKILRRPITKLVHLLEDDSMLPSSGGVCSSQEGGVGDGGGDLDVSPPEVTAGPPQESQD